MLMNDIQIEEARIVHPFVGEKRYSGALSYGLGTCGYDVRLGDSIAKWYGSTLIDPVNGIIPESVKPVKIDVAGYLLAPHEFVLGYTHETIALPSNIEGSVKDKSTLARLGLQIKNTILEPGWRGQITIEISNEGPHTIVLRELMPIAQIQFQKIETPRTPYNGRYQDQEGVTPAKLRA